MFQHIEHEWKIDDLINAAIGGCGIIFNYKFAVC
ncbi:hypothetical protein P344_03585 [Spiroplasma mirum ATCC 29335]|uniref:Uncharacterized protein n=1 Tax=Spiroplasma mirum ATCC 29335 TaxID=838561 RepID=W6AL64_9MOLU|nr:hypothetical protein P344_03585 [Spiroplasma mirum ATCC 29335]